MKPVLGALFLLVIVTSGIAGYKLLESGIFTVDFASKALSMVSICLSIATLFQGLTRSRLDKLVDVKGLEPAALDFLKIEIRRRSISNEWRMVVIFSFLALSIASAVALNATPLKNHVAWIGAVGFGTFSAVAALAIYGLIESFFVGRFSRRLTDELLEKESRSAALRRFRNGGAAAKPA